MLDRRENHGYCFIKGRISPAHMLSALHNIPYDFLPPTLKRAEDILVKIGIEPSYSRPPQFNKISDDLIDSAKSMENISKKAGVDYIFKGTIPFIKPYSTCHFGQENIDMIKHIDFKSLYLGMEDGMYSFSRYLRDINNILNEEGKKIISPVLRDELNEISLIASDLYKNKREIYDTEREKQIRDELDVIGDTLGWEAKNDAYALAENEIHQLQNDSVNKYKDGIHKYWLEGWYDEFAWDFDEQEREVLDNPYVLEKKTKDGKKIWLK